MIVKVRDSGKECIIDVLADEISTGLVHEIKEIVSLKKPNTRIAFNLLNISSLSRAFLDFIEKSDSKISLFNIPLNVYLLLFIMKYDKIADLYMSEKDFILNRHSVVNRNFKLVGNQA